MVCHSFECTHHPLVSTRCGGVLSDTSGVVLLGKGLNHPSFVWGDSDSPVYIELAVIAAVRYAGNHIGGKGCRTWQDPYCLVSPLHLSTAEGCDHCCFHVVFEALGVI